MPKPWKFARSDDFWGILLQNDKQYHQCSIFNRFFQICSFFKILILIRSSNNELARQWFFSLTTNITLENIDL